MRAERVPCISIDQLRLQGPAGATAILDQACDGTPIVANAACDEDLEVLALGVQEAESRGKRFLYRTSASFVKVRGGIEDRPLLTRADMGPGPGAGLVIAGSYVARTTAQIDVLAKSGRVTPVEISVPALLAERETRSRGHPREPRGRGGHVRRFHRPRVHHPRAAVIRRTSWSRDGAS